MEKKKISLANLKAPDVILSNVYYWKPESSYNKSECLRQKYYDKVYEWLMCLNERFGLGLHIVRTKRYIRAFEKFEQNFFLVARFYYFEYRDRVIKRQDFRKLLKLIKSKI
jgi:hypothetical protein